MRDMSSIDLDNAETAARGRRPRQVPAVLRCRDAVWCAYSLLRLSIGGKDDASCSSVRHSESCPSRPEGKRRHRSYSGGRHWHRTDCNSYLSARAYPCNHSLR